MKHDKRVCDAGILKVYSIVQPPVLPCNGHLLSRGRVPDWFMRPYVHICLPAAKQRSQRDSAHIEAHARIGMPRRVTLGIAWPHPTFHPLQCIQKSSMVRQIVDVERRAVVAHVPAVDATG